MKVRQVPKVISGTCYMTLREGKVKEQGVSVRIGGGEGRKEGWREEKVAGI